VHNELSEGISKPDIFTKIITLKIKEILALDVVSAKKSY
jgi:hypothetical protein